MSGESLTLRFPCCLRPVASPNVLERLRRLEEAVFGASSVAADPSHAHPDPHPDVLPDPHRSIHVHDETPASSSSRLFRDHREPSAEVEYNNTAESLVGGPLRPPSPLPLCAAHITIPYTLPRLHPTDVTCKQPPHCTSSAPRMPLWHSRRPRTSDHVTSCSRLRSHKRCLVLYNQLLTRGYLLTCVGTGRLLHFPLSSVESFRVLQPQEFSDEMH